MSQEAQLIALGIPDSLTQNANSVVRTYDVEYRVSSPRSATVKYRKVVTLLNEDHGSACQLVEWYDPDVKITRFNGTSYTALGQEITKLKRADIEDRPYLGNSTFYGDTRLKSGNLHCDSYPCTVVLEVEKDLKDFGMMQFPHWQPQRREQSVERAAFRAYVAEGNELLFNANLLPEPRQTIQDGERIYVWEVTNLPAQPEEPYAPPVTQTLPYLRLGLADFQIDDYTGSFSSWNDFGIFMRDIMAGRDELPEQLRQLAQETIAGATTDRERITRLYRLLQERTRYVSIQLGIGGWQPFPVDYVEANRYGDCKALSNYMGALLQVAGIETYPVLINWNDDVRYPVESDFATSAFNHMVLYVPSEEMYLECTSTYAPAGYLGSGKEDRNVLWVTPQGGRLKRTPLLVPANNGYTRTLNLEVTENKLVNVDFTASFYGASQEPFRAFAAEIPDVKEQRKRLHEIGFLPDVSGKAFRLDVEPDRPVATLGYQTTVDNYLRKLGTRIFLPLNAYFAHEWTPEKNEGRQLPIVRNTARLLVDTINVSYPSNLEIESGADELVTSFSHAAGEYRSEVKPTKTGVRWIRSLKLQPVTLPKEAYADFREFFVEVARAERVQLVLREKKTK